MPLFLAEFGQDPGQHIDLIGVEVTEAAALQEAAPQKTVVPSG
jgi:hypothetical protein